MATMASLVALGAGVVTHQVYLKRGEHHMEATKYLQIFLGALATSIFSLYQLGLKVPDAVKLTLVPASFYIVGIYSSLLLYRVFFHPLNRFPGPLGARISNLWFSFHIRKSVPYRRLLDLHNKHGDFVRIGSSDLSITHPQAVNAIFGPKSKCYKGYWYDFGRPLCSLQSYRDNTLHANRRRVWSSAFGEKSLRGYEQRIKQYRDKLMEKLDDSHGQPINVTRLFNYFTFDVMGDLSFGKSFDMLETDKEHWGIKVLNDGLSILYWELSPWVLRLLRAIPGALKDWWNFVAFCEDQIVKRRKAHVEIPDLMSTLLEELKGREPTPEESDLLTGDSQLIIVAGSDTTAATLTCLFYELARKPEHIQKLRDELTNHMSGRGGDILNQDIINLDHLNGAINETLRLYPPVPSIMERLTPPEGLQIGETFIPGNMTVSCPQYVIGRKEDIFPQPNEFVPERWYSRPDMAKDKQAQQPFSTGPYGCIGRPLALMTLRTVIARIIMDYDISFPADKTTRDKFEADTWEHFTLVPGALDICFEKRKQ